MAFSRGTGTTDSLQARRNHGSRTGPPQRSFRNSDPAPHPSPARQTPPHCPKIRDRFLRATGSLPPLNHSLPSPCSSTAWKLFLQFESYVKKYLTSTRSVFIFVG